MGMIIIIGFIHNYRAILYIEFLIEKACLWEALKANSDLELEVKLDTSY